MSWWGAARAVVLGEWQLLRQHPKLAWAFAGLLFVQAVYALIYLSAMWDPAAHTRALPAALVNLDRGAAYRERELNLGHELLAAIERHGPFAFRRLDDPATARAAVRRGELAFVLEIPADFSQRALPGERAGAARLTIYTSEGNNYSAAGFARRFAPEVAQRVNTMLGEARWDLVLTTAAGSRRDLESLRVALAELGAGAAELHHQLERARAGGAQLAQGSAAAADAALRLRGGAAQLAEASGPLVAGLRQAGSALHAMDARRPPEPELTALRLGMRQQLEGQRELARGLDGLGQGARRLGLALEQLHESADEVPLFGGRLVAGMAPIEDGARRLVDGLDQAGGAATRLAQGAQRIDEGLGGLVDAALRSSVAVNLLAARLPDDARLDSFADGARELARGSDALAGALKPLAGGAGALHGGLVQLLDGAGRLDTGLELLRQSLPQAVDAPQGSAQGLALSVQPTIEVAAPVPNNGVALTPNFVPLALWVGAVMACFLVHLRRVPEALAGLPRSALAAGKLALPAAVVLLQALLMLGMLVGLLHVPLPHPALFVLTLATASLAFLALVWALVRLLGDLGKVMAVLLLVVQVSAAGALLPIELSDEVFQALHPWLPLTWVVRAFRASLFGAYDGSFWPAWGVVATIAVVAFVAGSLGGRWRGVPAAAWRPPLDIE